MINEELNCKNTYRPYHVLLICNIHFLLILAIKHTLGPKKYNTTVYYVYFFETLKCINFHIRKTYKGYSFKNVSSKICNMWSLSIFAIQLFKYSYHHYLFHMQNLFQNGAHDVSEMVNIICSFLRSEFCEVRPACGKIVSKALQIMNLYC